MSTQDDAVKLSSRMKLRKPQDHATWLGVIGTWAQVIAAVASTVLAWQAVKLAEQYKEEDRAKDELLISPYLIFDKDLFGGTLELKNVGFGPAVISAIGIKSRDRRMVVTDRFLTDDNGTEFQSIMTEAFHIFSRHKEMAELVKKYKIVYSGRNNGQLLLPGHIIQKDTGYQMIVTNSKEILEDNNIPVGEGNKWRDLFASSNRDYNINVCYCSVTAKRCFITEYASNLSHTPIKNCKDMPVPQNDDGT
jgi:hypothetical protein